MMILTDSYRGSSTHRVIAAFLERVTAKQTFDAHPNSAQHSMAFHGFTHVVGTGGVITAGRGQ